MFNFEAFQPGKVYGNDQFIVERKRIEDWLKMYPGDDNGDLMPPGMTTMVQIQAYMKIITPRPPGNVHGSQRFEILRLPSVGSTIQTEVRCVGKEIRKGRCWVQTEYVARDATDAVLFTGLMTTLVAA